jgi:hypothetical protein
VIAVLATSSCSLATSAHDPLCYPPKSELELKDRIARLSAYSQSLRQTEDLAYERHVRPIETGGTAKCLDLVVGAA